MAGTLVVDTVKSSTTSPPIFQNTNGTAIGTLCRAWVNFGGVTTVTINASFNISSITRNGTGDYTVTFSTSFADALYAVTSQGQRPEVTAPGSPDSVVSYCSTTAPTSSAVRIKTSNGAGTATDFDLIALAVFR